MSDPLSPPAITSRAVGALPPYLANGIIGIRHPGLPHLPGTTMVNGFAGLDPADGVEGFARAPYALAIDVRLGDVWASSAPEWVELTEQRHDFASGELFTSWRFRVGGTTGTIEMVAFCSRTVPALAALELAVRTEDLTGYRSGRRPPQSPGPMGGCAGTRPATSPASASP